MESLFEKYVHKVLEKQIQPLGYSIIAQLTGRHLSQQPKAFSLKPDLGIYDKDKKLICIVDTKWKLIDSNAKYDDGKQDVKSGVAQSDVYQMFAYGHKYLSGRGHLVLMYPSWSGFKERLPTFYLDAAQQLILDVVPFDLNAEICFSMQMLGGGFSCLPFSLPSLTA